MVVMCAVAVSVDVTVAVSVDVTPTVLSSLLSWLCSSFAGDVANSVSLLLSGVPQVRGVLADVVLLAGLVATLVTWSISRLSGLAWGSASRDIVASRTMLIAFTGHVTYRPFSVGRFFCGRHLSGVSGRVPAAGSRVLLVCALGVEAIRRSGGTGRHCAKPGCRTRGGDSVGRSPVCQRSAVLRFNSRLSSPGSGKSLVCLSDGRSGRRSP